MHHHGHRLAHGELAQRRPFSPKGERQRLLTQHARGAHKNERHLLPAHDQGGAGHVGRQCGIECQGLNAQAQRVDHLKQQFTRIDHLAGHGVGRGNDARHRRHQRVACRQPRRQRRVTRTKAFHLALKRLDVLARHRVRELPQARQALAGEAATGTEFGQLRGLVRAFYRRSSGQHIGQHLAFAHGLPDRGQTARTGLQPPGYQGLHLAARVGVHHDLAREFARARQLLDFAHERSHAHLALRRLGQKHAAVGQTLRAPSGDCGVGLRAVVAPVVARASPGR